MKKIVNRVLKNFGLKLIRRPKNKYKLDLYKKLYTEEVLIKKPFYNIGAGHFYHPYWTNVDHYSDWYKSNEKYTNTGINYDLMSLTQIPISDNNAKHVYTSHTIEHIKDEHAMYLFKEVYRILETGGLFRITAPDIDLHYLAYKNSDFDFFYWRKMYEREEDYKRVKLNRPLTDASIAQLFLQTFASAATQIHADGIDKPISDDELKNVFNDYPYEEALNYCSNKCPIEIQKKYPGNHTNWWNRKKVISFLENAGFCNIRISGYGQSECLILRDTNLFDKTHPPVSLYIEAKK
jgi:predicted SAM-dependent methyltransferase